MLTPEFLAGIADDIVKLYGELDDLITRDIVRRLLKAGEMTETALWQANKAQQSGMLYDDVIKKVSEFGKISDEQVRGIFEEAGAKALNFDISVYKAAGLSPVPLRQSAAAAQVLKAGISKTNGLIHNLTRTTANAVQQAYIHAATIAEMQITSGAFDPHTAIRNAVNAAIKEGTHIIYPSGHRDRVDVAIRRAVVTGVSQTTGEISLQYASDMGCDLMEISAHFGARPSHAEWQGKIVSLSGRSGYLSIDDIGYGTGAGFKGWNCRHDWYPFFEGISRRAYSEQRLKEYADQTVKYGDEEIPYYEATQKQREMERSIRESRRQLAGYDEAIKNADKQTSAAIQADFERASVKLKQQEAIYKDFANQTGLSRQTDRIQVSGFDRSVSQKAVQANKLVEKIKKEDIIKEKIREAGNLSKKAEIHLEPKSIDVDSLSFDEKHINKDRMHHVTESQAKQWIKDSKISTTVWGGKFERYYGVEGTVYVNLNENNIRTAFSHSEYGDAVKSIMEVIKKYGL